MRHDNPRDDEDRALDALHARVRYLCRDKTIRAVLLGDLALVELKKGGIVLVSVQGEKLVEVRLSNTRAMALMETLSSIYE